MYLSFWAYTRSPQAVILSTSHVILNIVLRHVLWQTESPRKAGNTPRKAGKNIILYSSPMAQNDNIACHPERSEGYNYIYWKFIIFQHSLMKNLVKNFLKYFFIVIAAYHIIVTILWYGIIWWNSQTIISIIRDALRVIFILLVIIWDWDWLKSYLKKWWKVWIRFCILIWFSLITSYLKWVSLSNIMIWIKYWFYYLFIFLSASYVWFQSLKKFELNDLKWVQYLLMWILLVWFIRQILKIIKPDLFMMIGYWKLDDFYYGTNPPIYYLTWYEWVMRWQWIFAWPNNYWYFLVAFLPLILLLRWWSLKELKNFIKNPKWNLNFLLTILWIIAIILTLSRSAILWTIVVCLFVSRDWIKSHKKVSIWIFAIAIVWIIWLSILKKESTIWHLNSTFSYIWEIVNHPLWHWLWSSWPAIHHEWTMLPENYFMQIMLDVWTIWFIFWCIVIFYILIIFKSIQNHFKNWKISEENAAIYLQWKRLFIWWTALFIIGLFLHVFEDSMVNYLFFGLFGILSGYLSRLYEKRDIAPIKSMFKK